MSRVAVIGSGSWGTAVARHLAINGSTVAMWAHSSEVARAINRDHANPRYLTGCALPDSIVAHDDLEGALESADAVVYVVPSNHLRDVARRSSAFVDASAPVAVLTKGIEFETGKLMTQVVSDEIGLPERVAALSGPNHAEEVSRDVPSAAVIAGLAQCASVFQTLFHSDRFRTYVSDDVVGVEVCAACKNIVAIACGIARGWGGGDNTAAMLMTRGLAEMSRLVSAMGGNPLTCMGLAGMGDLVATCTSPHSRNATFGAAFAGGETLEQYQSRTHMVVEGALACRSVDALAGRLGVEAPLTAAVKSLLHDGVSMEAVVEGLYARAPREEFYGIR